MADQELSYPKHKIRALMLENIHPAGIEILRNEGYQVEEHVGAMSEDELADCIANYHLIGIRSNTKVTKQVLQSARRPLHAIGAFCIGTNQIDLTGAADRGIATFNAPYSNTRSVVELAVAEIIALSRGLIDKNRQLHEGLWNKSAAGSHEVRGKTLGIVGYGNIGSQLSVIAEALGMRVIYHDIADRLALGNAQACNSLDELLGRSDVVSLHVDARPGNAGFFGEEQFLSMKPGALFLNLSRGFLVDTDSLAGHLRSGRIGGAAVDVFPTEPKSKDEPFKNPLQGLDNCILTPHVGGSTEEAQENIGIYVASKLVDYINTGASTMSVNLPELALPAQPAAHRLIHIHRNEPGVLAEINGLLAAHGVNVLGQYLSTRGEIGYVTTDIDRAYDASIITQLREMPATIRLRQLY